MAETTDKSLPGKWRIERASLLSFVNNVPEDSRIESIDGKLSKENETMHATKKYQVDMKVCKLTLIRVMGIHAPHLSRSVMKYKSSIRDDFDFDINEF